MRILPQIRAGAALHLSRSCPAFESKSPRFELEPTRI